ncbi:MAG: UbiA family prenyltransferase [Candidatus Thermoplasmatota archaeon]|jgi:4-hydroxybenzoate polyprenyltransferase|nr:UbiA family prenyltransferase [Candidatus Thermoplasmatota archaeon]
MIKEYLKLARSFNAVLTGISPVMGAIAMEQYDIFTLFMLFLVGFFGHTFGFVFNDIIDYRIDKTSKEISDRPLISGTITLKKAWFFAITSMLIAFSISLYLAYQTQNYFTVVVLAISALFITLYDLISKKFIGMDIFVAMGVFLLVLYGALTTVDSIYQITSLAWIVCILGSIQVLYMQFISGGLKDIENDYNRGAKTLAIKLGVRILDGKLKISYGFKALAYGLQIVDLIVVFLPFFLIDEMKELTTLYYLQWTSILFIGFIMFYLSYKLLSMKQFERNKARKYIGVHYMINFTIVPIMLMTLNPWVGILIFFPLLGFILNNLILHGTITQPKTM